MFPVSVSLAVCLYVALLTSLVLIMWVMDDYRTMTDRPDIGTEAGEHIQCLICGYAYADPSATEVSQCPRCGSFSEVKPHKA